MGVIHKLKEDVITFIIDQKKSNPPVSIRQLAIVTSEKFRIKVSKSSVSTALKNASLSSAVGRRAKNAAVVTKFTIPANRKSEISKSMQKAGFSKEEAEKKKKENAATKEASPQIEKNEKEEPLSLMPDPLAQEQLLPPVDGDIAGVRGVTVNSTVLDKDFLATVEHLRDQKKSKKTSLLKGMGFVFLKAAQWEASDKSLMSELFKSYISRSSHDSFDAACEIFLFLKFLGTESFDQISVYQEHGLWQLNKLRGSNSDENGTLLSLKELFQWGSNVTSASASSIVMEYSLEKKYIFSEVSGFELLLEDSEKLTIDAAISSLGFGIKAPINKSVAWLSNYIISNIHSPVFFKVPGEKKFDQTFYDMVAIFENFSGKKIQKVVILDQNNQEVARFSTIPARRRTFLIGVSPQQKEFAQLTKNIKWAGKEPFYHQETDRVVYYGEAKTNSLASQFKEKINDFRMIAIWQDKEKDPFWAVLTNLNKGGSEDILKAYMSRWPYFGGLGQKEGKSDFSEKVDRGRDSSIQNFGKLEFQEIFSDFIQTLSQYCRKYYFPSHYFDMDISDIMKAVYEIPGSFCESGDQIIVSLEVPLTSPHRKDIEWALKRVNERHIFDHFGRRLWIEIIL